MIVMKFGGSSVKDAAALDRVASIIESRMHRRPLVVVSALGDTTDKLAAVLDFLENGRADYARGMVSEVRDHHERLIDEVLAGDSRKGEVHALLQANLARLERMVDGMDYLGEVSPRSRDAVLAFGETVAAPLAASFLASRGLPAVSLDSREIVVTDDSFGAARPLVHETRNRFHDAVLPLVEKGKVPVLGGYVGATRQGVVTTLGRGGSDLTASLAAWALGVEDLEYWKDVDGILTADPYLVPNAKPVPRLTFREAAELAFLGARVLHPASIQPAVDAGIPVRVLNSYRPGNPGTLIYRSENPAEDACCNESAVSSVACKRGQVLLNVYSTRMLGASGFLRRIFGVFDEYGISVEHIATSEVNVTLTFAPGPATEELCSSLRDVAAVEVEKPVGVVSLVGERLPVTPGVAARIFGAIRNKNVKLVTYGGSGVNLTFVVSDADVPSTVRKLHKEFFGD